MRELWVGWGYLMKGMGPPISWLTAQDRPERG